MRPMSLHRVLLSASCLLGVACILSGTISCNHHPVAANVSTTSPPPDDKSKLADKFPMQPDQVNTAGWDQAWTNLQNIVEQSFTPTLPNLLAVEVELVVGNPGPRDEELTLTVLDAQDHKLAVVAQNVSTRNPDSVIFSMPPDGIPLSPGELYRIRLSGGATFGWKYIVGGYPHGEAIFNGHPLLGQARSTFLFRTFGTQ